MVYKKPFLDDFDNLLLLHVVVLHPCTKLHDIFFCGNLDL
jgi:hypothetical protein